MYQKMESRYGTIILTERDGFSLSFPEDPANSDYQAYLAWVAEGNEPEIVTV